MLQRLIMFWRWVNEGFCYIRIVDGTREHVAPMSLNLAQERILAAMMDQAAAGKPIRIVTGKARKTGVSTFDQALKGFLCAHYPEQRAVMIAHEAGATDEIFEIAKRVASRYSPIIPTEPKARTIDYAAHGSRYTCQTAGGVAVGAGGTPNLLHMSELSKWERNKTETEYNARIAIPDQPTTIIHVESTFKGRDLFCRRFDEAADPDNPYTQVFIAWYVDDRCVLEAPEGFSHTAEERILIGRAHAEGIELSNDQLQWRRSKIRELGADVFRQEYPSTPTEAIQATTGIILPGMRECVVDGLPFEPGALPFSNRVGGIDFGYHDAYVVWSGYYVDQVLTLTNYWRGVESLADEQVEGLRDGHTYYCDPANVSDRYELQRAAHAAGLKVKLLPAPRRKHPGEDPSTTELKRLVRLSEQGRFLVMREAATQLIVECDSFMWNERTGKPDDRRTEDAGHFDSIMAAKYCVMGVDVPSIVAPKPRESKPTRRQQWARV